MAEKRSLTKTSQLFQEESSYKLFGWNKVAAGFSEFVNWKILELWTLYLTYVIRNARRKFWRTHTYLYNWRASVASETLTGVKMKKSGMFIYWRASEASETVLGVDNAKSGICYIYICRYVCMDCTYAL